MEKTKEETNQVKKIKTFMHLSAMTFELQKSWGQTEIKKIL